ncbi:MAG: hypothetical protein ACI8QC_004453 [Planctomycetota bacterium]|jgi:hypothetical protein
MQNISLMHSLRLATGPALAFALLQAGANGQSIDWLEFAQNDSLLVGQSSTAQNDTEERDFAWGDLDQDGWTDLISVRKQPFTSQGKRKNVLFMNESGSLVDRTSSYASNSDVPGDNGFLTDTNDRDVLIADVDGDGWDDVITATTFTLNQPKHISHPRIYMNLGNDGQGNWLGLRHEDARIPQLFLVSGPTTVPFFCGVDAGDVDGDGSLDLYFADYDVSGNPDVDDRLLINDGNGFFTDETSSRMSVAMVDSPFGNAVKIRDMNGDGVMDIVRNTGVGQTSGQARIDISYNNPNNEGTFNILHAVNTQAPYHVDVGDLNQDGLLDLITSDDGADRYMLNQGNDGLGRVQWSSAHAYNTDDGFGSNNLISDLDNDGWPDVLIADVDVDIAGYGRRMHIYHNKGGTVGGFVNIDEESGNGFRGATGFTTSLMRCTHDMAVFDIDNDGFKDIVTARCEGTNVWINQSGPQIGPIGTAYCSPATPNSTGFPAFISATGLLEAASNTLTLTSTLMPSNQFAYYLVGATQGSIANPGGSQGTLCLSGSIGRFTAQVGSTGALGVFSINVDLNALPSPMGAVQVMSGETWNFTAWYRDVNPTPTSNFTDGVSVTFQ